MGLEKLSSNVWSHYLKIYVWLEGRALYRLRQEPPSGTFGDGVKYYLSQIGTTQEELAARMGVATETVSRICRDVYEPPINMAIAVCIALHLLPYQTVQLIGRLGYTLEGVSEQIRAYRLIVNVYYEESVASCNRRLLKHRLKPLTNPRDRYI